MVVSRFPTVVWVWLFTICLWCEDMRSFVSSISFPPSDNSNLFLWFPRKLKGKPVFVQWACDNVVRWNCGRFVATTERGLQLRRSFYKHASLIFSQDYFSGRVKTSTRLRVGFSLGTTGEYFDFKRNESPESRLKTLTRRVQPGRGWVNRFTLTKGKRSKRRSSNLLRWLIYLIDLVVDNLF